MKTANNKVEFLVVYIVLTISAVSLIRSMLVESLETIQQTITTATSSI